MAKSAKIKIENVLQPGKTYNIDAAMFKAMKAAVLKVMPSGPPGMTPSEIRKAALAFLQEDLFPGGEKAGWWVKAVQLDQEAKKVIMRSQEPPVRLWKI